MSNRVLRLLLLTAACAGCGQVGPLHLPQDAPDNENYLLARKKAPAATPAPAAAEKPAAAQAPASSTP